MSIKYLFKYLTKGPDRIRAVIEDNIYTEQSKQIIYKEIENILKFFIIYG